LYHLKCFSKVYEGSHIPSPGAWVIEGMRRAFYGQFTKDIKIDDRIGVMLPSSFDRKDWNDLTFEEQVHGPPEYSQQENRDT
jgi:hypothetical protein